MGISYQQDSTGFDPFSYWNNQNMRSAGGMGGYAPTGAGDYSYNPQQNYGSYGGASGNVPGMGYGAYGGGYNPYGGQQYQPQPWAYGGSQYQQGGDTLTGNSGGGPAPSNLGNRRQRINSQISGLQQQYAAAGTQDQGAIQNQISGLQGRLQNVKQQAQQNRQAARTNTQAPQPENTAAPTPAYSGNVQGFGNMQGFVPTDQFGNPTTMDAYNKRMSSWQNGLQGLMSPSLFNTQFGQLTPISGSPASNVYKVQGQSEGDNLFNYDPTKGWQQMSGAQYRANPGASYFNPLSSEQNARNAGAQAQQFSYYGR